MGVNYLNGARAVKFHVAKVNQEADNLLRCGITVFTARVACFPIRRLQINAPGSDQMGLQQSTERRGRGQDQATSDKAAKRRSRRSTIYRVYNSFGDNIVVRTSFIYPC